MNLFGLVHVALFFLWFLSAFDVLLKKRFNVKSLYYFINRNINFDAFRLRKPGRIEVTFREGH